MSAHPPRSRVLDRTPAVPHLGEAWPALDVPNLDALSRPELRGLSRVLTILASYAWNRDHAVGYREKGMTPEALHLESTCDELHDTLPACYRWAPAPAPERTGNATAKPITCPDCGAEITPDDSARLDVLAALDAHAHACFSRSLDIASTRARLLALLGIADR